MASQSRESDKDLGSSIKRLRAKEKDRKGALVISLQKAEKAGKGKKRPSGNSGKFITISILSPRG